MLKIFQGMHPIVFILIATILEVVGDAVIRISIYKYTGVTRGALMVAGALFLFGYGSSLNLAPLEFGQVVGLYIATLFIVWQAINFIAFGKLPSVPIVTGGTLIIIGGAIITFWKQ